MRAAILTLALLLTASGCPQEPTKQPTTSCHEEDPCWNDGQQEVRTWRDEGRMSDIVICRSTRLGAGCGHPVGDHIGEGKTPNTDCCCCSWRQNDPGHARTCLDCAS